MYSIEEQRYVFHTTQKKTEGKKTWFGWTCDTARKNRNNASRN